MIVSDDLALASVAIGMKRKFDKYWGTAEKMNMLLFVPVILDPRKKLIYVEHTLTDMYDSEIGLKMTALASECLSHLFNEYKNAFAPPPPPMPTTDLGFQGDSNNNTLSVGEQMRVKQRAQREQALHRRSHMGFGEKTELQKYLDESPEHVASGKVFNILEWWKLLAPRYPILARLARDIFAMPISTVASESVFSTGGRIISDFRSSLTPKTAQALICGQNWLREEPLPSIEEDFQFMSLVENDALP